MKEHIPESGGDKTEMENPLNEVQRRGSIETIEREGIKYPFHLFIPEKVKTQNFIIWGHGSEKGEDIKEATLDQFDYYTETFEELGIPAVMPILPRLQKESESLDAQIFERKVMLEECQSEYSRPDREVVKIGVETRKILKQKGIDMEEKFLIGGVSAGATMADRFSFLYPQLVAGKALFLSGLFVYPEEKLNEVDMPYPFGTKDFKKLEVGENFSQKDFLNIPTYLYIGSEDNSEKNNIFNFESRNLSNEQKGRMMRVVGENQLEITKKYSEYMSTKNPRFKSFQNPQVGHKASLEEVRKGVEYLVDTLKEKELTNLEKLVEYEKQGYVFHGSPSKDIEMLEPRLNQDPNAESDFDNDTAVFAARMASVAVIFACATENSVPKEIWDSRSWVWSMDVGGPSSITAKISTEWKPFISKSSGYIYVLENKHFTLKEGLQVKSREPVKPMDVIKVEFSDFEKLGGVVEWKED
jgi:predicted esterase